MFGFLGGFDGCNEGISGLVVQCSVKIPKHFEGILRWRLGHKAGNRFVIPNQYYLFLLRFETIHDGAEVPSNFGYGKHLHDRRLSDDI